MKEEQVKMAASAGIYFPTILPLFKNPLDQKALAKWVACHKKLPKPNPCRKLQIALESAFCNIL